MSGQQAVVERKLIGGSCPNIACLPSKNIIHSAKVAELASRGAEFGVTKVMRFWDSQPLERMLAR